MNDLARVTNKLTPIVFADDTNFFLHSKDLEVMETLINHELKDIIRWLYANKLSLNIRKTKVMLFNIGNNKIPSNNITIKILNEKIESNTLNFWE